MFFIENKYVSVDRWRDVTYGRVVLEYHLEKSDPYRTGLTVGGDRVNYLGDCSTAIVGLTTVKLLLNSIVLTLNAKSLTIYINCFYLNTHMERSKYMRLRLSNIPKSMVQQYNLEAKATKDGYVHVDIKWGMYCLLQAGVISHKLLDKGLNEKGYK